MLRKLWIYFMKKLLDFAISLLKSSKTMSIIGYHAFHHFRHAPIHICLNLYYRFIWQYIYICAKCHFLKINWNELSDKNNQKWYADIAHSLDITTLRMSHVPYKQNSSQSLLNYSIFKDFRIFVTDSFDVAVNCSMYFFLILVEVLWIPIIFYEFFIFLTFST